MGADIYDYDAIKISTLKGDRLYTVTYFAPPDTFYTFLPIVQKMLSYFKNSVESYIYWLTTVAIAVIYLNLYIMTLISKNLSLNRVTKEISVRELGLIAVSRGNNNASILSISSSVLSLLCITNIGNNRVV